MHILHDFGVRKRDLIKLFSKFQHMVQILEKMASKGPETLEMYKAVQSGNRPRPIKKPLMSLSIL